MSRIDSLSKLGRLDESRSQQSQKKDDIFVNLDSFRQDLRKQISDKIRTNTKYLDFSSPTHTNEGGLTSLLSHRAADRPLLLPKENTTSLLKSPSSNNTPSDSSKKRFEFNFDISQKKNSQDTLKSTATKPFQDLGDILNKKRESYRSSMNSDSQSSRNLHLEDFTAKWKTTNHSPSKNYPKDTKSSFLKNDLNLSRQSGLSDNKYSAQKTPKQSLRDDISKILDTGNQKTPLSNKENESRFDSKPFLNLDSELSKFKRTSKVSVFDQPSPASKTGARSQVSSSQKKFDENLRGFGSTSELFEKENYGGAAKKNASFLSNDNARKSHRSFKDEFKSKTLQDQIPLAKLYELQDLMTDVGKDEFNELPANYIEELIKVALIIIYRVKSSNYYSKV
jgi:hypothetical protein